MSEQVNDEEKELFEGYKQILPTFRTTHSSLWGLPEPGLSIKIYLYCGNTYVQYGLSFFKSHRVKNVTK